LLYKIKEAPVIIIEIRNLTFGYKKGKPIYNNLSLTLGKYPCEGLVGPNGAGKSTLVKLLLGLKKPWSGEIIIPKDTVMGFLPEIPTLPEELSVSEFLIDMAVSGGLPLTEAYKTTDLLLINLKLDAYRDSKIKTLSKGTLQRVVFAQAIIHGPSYVILDEPTSGLDPLSRKHMLSLISTISNLGIKVLMSTHILTDIKQVCQRVISIDNGQVISDIEINNLIKHDTYIVETSSPDILLKHLPGKKLSDVSAIINTDNPDNILRILADYQLPVWKLEPLEEDIYEVVTHE
jgi:ABC-2 type transport system ATP-binding protein